MKLSKNIKLIGKSLFLIKEKTLVISDLHVGFEQAALDSGFFIPKTQYEDIKKSLNEIFKEVRRINKIIVLGDLKHNFGNINKQEWKETLEILDLLNKNCKEIILIKGNHDPILEPIASKFGLTIKDYYVQDNIAFFHGNKIWNELYNKNIKIWVIGHKHPAITIRKGAKSEIYKCFLVGKFQDKQLIIMPSFFPLVEGSDVFIYDAHFAFKINEKNFEVYVIADKIYDFGKVKDVGRLS